MTLSRSTVIRSNVDLKEECPICDALIESESRYNSELEILFNNLIPNGILPTWYLNQDCLTDKKNI